MFWVLLMIVLLPVGAWHVYMATFRTEDYVRLRESKRDQQRFDLEQKQYAMERRKRHVDTGLKVAAWILKLRK
jgi:hypothetical protein